jgi:hypothetical protein
VFDCNRGRSRGGRRRAAPLRRTSDVRCRVWVLGRWLRRCGGLNVRPGHSSAAGKVSSAGARLPARRRLDRMGACQSADRAACSSCRGEPVGELAAVIGQDGVHRLREVGEEALQECSCGPSVALAVDLQIDVAGGAVDRDIGLRCSAGRCLRSMWMKPTPASSKAPTAGLSACCRALIPVPFETA